MVISQFSFWISITLVKIYIPCVIINGGKNTIELVGTVLNNIETKSIYFFFFLQTIERINEVFDFMTLFCSSSQANLKKKSQSFSFPECSTEIWPALLLMCHLPRPGTISSPCISWTADAQHLQKPWPEHSSVRFQSQARTTSLHQ